MRTLADFIGAYDVSRVIDDAHAGGQSRFEGRAVIAPDDAGAVYTETGHLIVNAQRFQAERSYLWRENGPRVDVLFADGRAFHDFDPQAGGHAAEHLCGEDMYRGGYDFSEWSCWAVTWDVQGPRKDYRSVTWYVRSD
ncbi:DUF6314 family protein [Octadecabacter sp. G9-8]|uniref:DUF6314 family protein n=1 Tax=Octadecabacter dasysiphoniae TaxID=2909341 RepID=A0ABS9D0Q3_9RHOB|nr:DUF6314 family protein [Octadecabacter dasysiphoniae]MCF2872205.1 DUF6314 family protein [Octadecabacter dasysiphoniae]